MTGERRVLLGKIVGVFGVRGFVKLQSHTEPHDALFDYLPWTLRSPRGVESEVKKLVEGRPQGRGLVALLPGVATRDEAEALIGTEIWVDRAKLPRPKRGEYYWVDLEGCAVETVEGVALGTVSHLFGTGANDVMSVVEGGKERLIPFIHDDVVKSVDLDARRLVVDWDPDF